MTIKKAPIYYGVFFVYVLNTYYIATTLIINDLTSYFKYDTLVSYL